MAGAFRFIFGFYPKTDSIESKEKALLAEYNKLKEIELSDELARYHFLEKHIQSQEFKDRKKELEKLTFPGSEEHLKEQEYIRLKKLSDIVFYYKYKKSTDLADYLKADQSKDLENYKDLKAFLQSDTYKQVFEYMTDKKRFEKTPEFKQLQEYSAMNENPGFKNYFKFIKSGKYADFESLYKTVEIENFKTLENYINSKEFAQLKSGPKQDYRSSEAPAKLQEYKSLKKSSRFKNYFKLLNSSLFADFKKLHSSEELNYFLTLQKNVESEAFKSKKKQIDSMRFEGTPEFQKLQQFKSLEKSSLLKKYFKIQDSKQYAHYKHIDGSKEITHYEELEKFIQSDEFIKSKAYLLDTKKWEKTEDFKLAQELEVLKKSNSVIWYFKNVNLPKYSEIKSWKLLFEDHFDKGKLDSEKWISRYFWGEMLLGESFALPGEKHIFTDKNIELNGSTVKLITKQGKVSGKEWHPAFGFYPKDFDYTSGLISTGKSHRQKYGRIEAKIKIPQSQGISHAFWLSGNSKLPQVDIFKFYNQKMYFNSYWGNSSNNDINKDEISISASAFSKGFFIYSLEWTPDRLVWKINNLVVKTQTIGVPEEPLYLVINSGKFDEGTASLPSQLEIDWVRCYEKLS